MPKFNKLLPETHQIYHEDDGFIGDMDYFEFKDFIIQIMNEQASGYYVLFNGCNLYIDKDGRVDNWPNDMYGLIDEQLRKLCKWD